MKKVKIDELEKKKKTITVSGTFKKQKKTMSDKLTENWISKISPYLTKSDFRKIPLVVYLLIGL